jgi:hypothetical protein
VDAALHMIIDDTPEDRWHEASQNLLEPATYDDTKLIAWLDGYGELALTDLEEEPYLCLLRRLPTDSRLPAFEERLAASIISILQRYPRLDPPDCDSDRVAYNLLLLSAHLRCRNVLAKPLRALMDSGALEKRSHAGIDLRHALRFALIANQPDSDLEPLWVSMIAGRPSPRALGTPHDGIRGVIYMRDGQRPGRPASDAIGRAVKEYARAIRSSPGRVETLADVLDLAAERFPGYFDRDRFVCLWDEHHWPDWVEAALPSLFFVLGEHRYILWRPVYEYAHKFSKVNLNRTLCGGKVFDVSVPSAGEIWLQRIAQLFEEFRYRCDSGRLAVANALFALEENRWTGGPAAIHQFVEAMRAA